LAERGIERGGVAAFAQQHHEITLELAERTAMRAGRRSLEADRLLQNRARLAVPMLPEENHGLVSEHNRADAIVRAGAHSEHGVQLVQMLHRPGRIPDRAARERESLAQEQGPRMVATVLCGQSWEQGLDDRYGARVVSKC